MKNKFDTSKYIMIPYENKGRNMGGCDCWGLVYLIYLNEYGINLPTLSNEYSDASEGEQIAKTIKENKPLIGNIKKDIPEYGDIAVFVIKGNPCHVGIYIGKNRVLHILKGTNSCIENINSFRLKGRMEGYYEIL